MIPGFFAPAVLPQPLIRVAVHIDGLQPDWAVVPFVIDTGAALTCIHAIDAVRLFGMSPASLDPTTWADPTPVGGIGGGLNYMERSASYVFLHTDGTTHQIDGVIKIGELRSQSTPALLGWDLLKHFRLEVHGSQQTVLLEPA